MVNCKEFFCVQEKYVFVQIWLHQVFCFLGDPKNVREGKVIDTETDHVVRVLNWIKEPEHLTRTERTVFERNEDQNHIRTTSKVLEKCSCDRKKEPNITRPVSSDFPNSTCDWFATSRGSGQKVVSYSFYGDLNQNPEVGRKYFNQIGARADEVKSLYPGNSIVLYDSVSM
jgi:hypothetical protein